MKLLFLTQVVDAGDAVLGFVPRWLCGLAANVEELRAVTLEAGDLSTLPSNVSVREVGRKGRVARYLRYRRILNEALSHDRFDAVLAHMVPRYALVADAPARRAGAGRFLWYTHAGVDARLRRAVERVEKVFTATPESLRLEPPNKVVTGHGIDLTHFDAEPVAAEAGQPQRLLSVGRLTPAKDPLTVIDALAQMRAAGRDVVLDLVGAGLARGDDGYANEVRARIGELGLESAIEMHGAVPYRDIPALFARANLLINASATGSLDKVVLEAMASRVPILSSNDSVPHVLRSLGARAEQHAFVHGDAGALSARAGALLDLSSSARQEMGEQLRGIVAREHEVDALMARLVAEMQPAGGER